MAIFFFLGHSTGHTRMADTILDMSQKFADKCHNRCVYVRLFSKLFVHQTHFHNYTILQNKLFFDVNILQIDSNILFVCSWREENLFYLMPSNLMLHLGDFPTYANVDRPDQKMHRTKSWQQMKREVHPCHIVSNVLFALRHNYFHVFMSYIFSI